MLTQTRGETTRCRAPPLNLKKQTDFLFTRRRLRLIDAALRRRKLNGGNRLITMGGARAGAASCFQVPQTRGSGEAATAAVPADQTWIPRGQRFATVTFKAGFLRTPAAKKN